MTLVVDASVAAKWILAEADGGPAIALYRREHGRMHAPDLLFVEVAGAVVRRANERAIERTTAIATLDGWSEISGPPGVTGHAIRRESVGIAARLAIELGHPIADCVYLALAIELDCPLVTCDAKFRARTAADHPRVRLLDEFA